MEITKELNKITLTEIVTDFTVNFLQGRFRCGILRYDTTDACQQILINILSYIEGNNLKIKTKNIHLLIAEAIKEFRDNEVNIFLNR